MHQLVVDHVSKSYGSQPVLRDLSFTVEPGRVTGFLGPNGAGKSTLMKILLGLASADGGTATIGERRYRDLADPARTVGVVLEPDAFHPGRSGRNHLRVLADVGGFSEARVEEVLELVGLREFGDRRAGAYSLGMRQRLSLAAALLGDPSVLVLDEPGNGLDPQGIHDLREVLRARAALGHTVFVSSHLLSEMEHLADEVVVLNRGRLVATGGLADLQQSSVTVSSPEVATLVDRLETAGAVVEAVGPHRISVRGVTREQVGDLAHLHGVTLHELADGTGSLEELFLAWTADDGLGPPGTEPGREHRPLRARVLHRRPAKEATR